MNPDIQIKHGFGDVVFEMPIEEVVAILGEADECETIDNAADETTTILRYNDRMTLFFEYRHQRRGGHPLREESI